jgi:hypothetical protein
VFDAVGKMGKECGTNFHTWYETTQSLTNEILEERKVHEVF